MLNASKDICVLNFHGLGAPARRLPEGEDDFWLDAQFFESILDVVRGRPEVRITFDDSNSSDYEIALPALLKRGMRATFFVVTERIGSSGFLSAQQVQQLDRAGMMIGSHGTRHRPWALLGASDLYCELNESRETLQGVVGKTVQEAACPFGSYNRRVLRALCAAGYVRVFTSDDGLARSDDWVLPRNTIERRHSLSMVARLLRPSRLSACSCKLKSALKRLM